MHIRNIVFCSILYLFSCQAKQPSDILSTNKMTSIITDLQLADAAYKLDMLPVAYKGQPQKYYLEILASHQTDSTAYNKSMQYYAENPKLLKIIYSGVEKNVGQAH